MGFFEVFLRCFEFVYSEKKIIDLEKPLLTGAFIDPNKITQYSEKDYILPEIPPFSWMIKNSKVKFNDNTLIWHLAFTWLGIY